MTTIVDGARPQDTCAQCGTTAYPRSSMVGNLCPGCSYENKTIEDTTAAVEAAVTAQRQAAEHRAEREAQMKEAAEAKEEADKAVAEVHDAVEKVVTSARSKARDHASAKTKASA